MLEGPDVSLEISLKEYGIAWKIGETNTKFYYGTGHNGKEFIHFDWANLENNVDVYLEFNWADLLEVSQFVGMTLKDWEKMPLTNKIQNMSDYYGVQDIFGGSYTEPMTYKEVIADEKEPV